MHSPVLEPDLDLSLGELEPFGQLRLLGGVDEGLRLELLLQHQPHLLVVHRAVLVLVADAHVCKKTGWLDIFYTYVHNCKYCIFLLQKQP